MAQSTKLSSLSVFFPAYNEAPNLEKLIQSANDTAKKLAKEYELLIVNDGSQDNTLEVIEELQKKYSKLRVISHPNNLGYGAALKTGIAHSQYDWIFFTDADMQFDIKELQKFIPHTQKHKVIIGWRRRRAEGGQRAFNANLFKLYINLLYRLHVKDIDCAFKLFDRSTVQSIELESSGAFTTAELLYKLKKRGIKFKELAVSHYPRYMGNPTGAQLKVILKACWESLALYLKIKKHSLFSKNQSST